MKKTLRDLGERNIVDQLIAPRFKYPGQDLIGVGDDCAVIPAPPPGCSLVFTTDPCPTPVVCLLDKPDFYHYGRFTVLINASDLAAMGATPIGLLVSTVMPEDMPTADFERFLDGVADASREWNCPVLGGNIKDGPQFSATGSALGYVDRNIAMLRTGAQSGDRVCVIGDMGLFWSSVLLRMNPALTVADAHRETLDRALYRPVPRLREGIALANARFATSCIDSSDGVIGCLRELANRNGLDIVVNNASLTPHPAVAAVSEQIGIDYRKLMLSWGDWQLVCTIRPSVIKDAAQLMCGLAAAFTDIGEVQRRNGGGTVYLEDRSQLREITNFASERFTETSFFTHGLQAYVDLLRTEPLTRRP